MTAAIEPRNTSTVARRRQSKISQTIEPTVQYVERLSETGANNQQGGPSATIEDITLDPPTTPTTTVQSTIQLRSPSGFVGELPSWPLSLREPGPGNGKTRAPTNEPNADAIAQGEGEGEGDNASVDSGTIRDGKREAQDYEYHTFLRER